MDEPTANTISHVARCGVAVIAIITGAYVLLNGFHYLACAGLFFIALSVIPNSGIKVG